MEQGWGGGGGGGLVAKMEDKLEEVLDYRPRTEFDAGHRRGRRRRGQRRRRRRRQVQSHAGRASRTKKKYTSNSRHNNSFQVLCCFVDRFIFSKRKLGEESVGDSFFSVFFFLLVVALDAVDQSLAR